MPFCLQIWGILFFFFSSKPKQIIYRQYLNRYLSCGYYDVLLEWVLLESDFELGIWKVSLYTSLSGVMQTMQT